MMNERILELADQASHQSPDGYPVTIPYSKDFAEKFAELIVRECADLLETSLPYNPQQKMIKKHFGVEE
ncbi:hypothetical protein UFOVP242_221 [uncultured Caudovirales phage]|uniref:Uncharacterized protein n=1 Tax=uncultured Caudovirales phage TaxID=2100421 RepID=A0A6J7WW72_9CAUD|nr:hypothetical protein UFOVP242_221 [uncultured Caudovirales phage]